MKRPQFPCQSESILGWADSISSLLDAGERRFEQDGSRVLHRGGPLSPALLATLLLYQARCGGAVGYRPMLDRFWDDARRSGLPLPTERPVSAAAFCTARRRLGSGFVRELLGGAAALFEQEHGAGARRRGRRLLGVDGAKRTVRRSDELSRTFGHDAGGHYPQITVSTLFDVVAQVPLDVVVGPGASCERSHLREMTRSIRPGDVVVADRGYPGFDMLSWLLYHEADFVVRVAESGRFAAVEEFAASGRSEDTVVLRRHAGCDSPVESIEVRLVRREVPGRPPWILMTSLPAEDFPADAVAEAYRLRRRVEEFYRMLTDRWFDQDLFHSTCADGVRQEVYAQMLLVVLARHVMAAAALEAGTTPSRLSRKRALLAVGDHLLRLLAGSGAEDAATNVRLLLRRVGSATYTPRPGRSTKRRSLRPQRKWTPRGRRNRG